MTDYITIEQLADYMDVDSLLEMSADLAIAAAEQAVRKHLGQEITLVEDDVEVRDGRGGRRLRLRQRPVREVTSVKIYDDELDTDEYQVDRSFIKLKRGFFPADLGNIEITYTHGWDSDPDYSLEPVPADVVLVTLNIARRAYERMGEQDDDMQAETIGGYSYQRRQEDGPEGAEHLLQAEIEVLEPYRIGLVP